MSPMGGLNPLTIAEIVRRTPKVPPVNWALAGAGHPGPGASFGMDFAHNLGSVELAVNAQGKTVPVILVRGG